MTDIDTTAPVVTVTREGHGTWIVTSTDGLAFDARGRYDVTEVLAMAEGLSDRIYAWRLTNDGFVSVGAIRD